MTKKQERELQALTQRVQDMYRGGGEYNNEPVDEYWLQIESAPAVIGALESQWPREIFGFDIYGLCSLDRFAHPITAAKFLYDNGARA